jgi:hypothetical protein
MFGYFCPCCGRTFEGPEARKQRSKLGLIDYYCPSCEGVKLNLSGRQLLFVAALGWILFFYALGHGGFALFWALVLALMALVQIVRHRRAVKRVDARGDARGAESASAEEARPEDALANPYEADVSPQPETGGEAGDKSPRDADGAKKHVSS